MEVEMGMEMEIEENGGCKHVCVCVLMGEGNNV
jgi:hypothetical protein